VVAKLLYILVGVNLPNRTLLTLRSGGEVRTILLLTVYFVRSTSMTNKTTPDDDWLELVSIMLEGDDDDPLL
jgi:hypothetical protein